MCSYICMCYLQREIMWLLHWPSHLSVPVAWPQASGPTELIQRLFPRRRQLAAAQTGRQAADAALARMQALDPSTYEGLWLGLSARMLPSVGSGAASRSAADVPSLHNSPARRQAGHGGGGAAPKINPNPAAGGASLLSQRLAAAAAELAGAGRDAAAGRAEAAAAALQVGLQ